MINLEMLGKRIRKLRKLNNIFQERMAEDLGMYQADISNIERAAKGSGINDLTKIAMIARCFGISTDELLNCYHDLSLPIPENSLQEECKMNESIAVSGVTEYMDEADESIIEKLEIGKKIVIPVKEIPIKENGKRIGCTLIRREILKTEKCIEETIIRMSIESKKSSREDDGVTLESYTILTADKRSLSTGIIKPTKFRINIIEPKISGELIDDDADDLNKNNEVHSISTENIDIRWGFVKGLTINNIMSDSNYCEVCFKYKTPVYVLICLYNRHEKVFISNKSMINQAIAMRSSQADFIDEYEKLKGLSYESYSYKCNHPDKKMKMTNNAEDINFARAAMDIFINERTDSEASHKELSQKFVRFLAENNPEDYPFVENIAEQFGDEWH